MLRSLPTYWGHWKTIVVVVIAMILNCPGCNHSKNAPKKKFRFFTTFSVSKEAVKELSPYGYTSAYFANQLHDRSKQEYELVATNGSFDSLLQLETSSKSMAIVQADVLYHYLHGGHPQFPNPKRGSRIRAVAKLFPDWLIAETEISSTTDKKKKLDFMDHELVFAGLEGSGSLVTSINVGRILLPKWHGEFHQSENLRSTLRLTVRSPELLESSNQMVFMSKASAKILSNAYHNIYTVVDAKKLREKKLIGKDDDHSLSKMDSRATIRVDAILVATRDVDQSTINHVRSIISDLNHEDQKRLSAGWNDKKIEIDDSTRFDSVKDNVLAGHVLSRTEISSFDKKSRFQNLPVASHPAIKVTFSIPFYDVASKFLAWTSELPSLAVIAIVTVVVVLEFFVLVIGVRIILKLSFDLIKVFRSPGKYLKLIIGLFDKVLRLKTFEEFQKVKTEWKKELNSMPRWYDLLGLIVAAHFAVGTLIWFAEFRAETLEPDTELAQHGGLSATIQIWRFLTVSEPLDFRSNWSVLWIALLRGGYAISTAAIVMGAGSKLLGWLGDYKMNDPVIVIGFNERFQNIKKELEEIQESHDRKIHVKNIIVRQPDSKSIPKSTAQKHVVVNSIEKAIESCGKKKQLTILILADHVASTELGFGDVDLWVAKVLSHICEYEQKHKDFAKNIVVEIMNEQNRSIALAIRPNTEIICVQHFGTELLALATQSPGISQVYAQLLKTTGQTNEIYFVNDLDRIGNTYNAAIETTRTKNLGLLIIGFVDKNGVSVLNPEEGRRNEAAKKIIVIGNDLKSLQNLNSVSTTTEKV